MAACPLASGGKLKLIQSRVSGGGYATDGASLLDEADFTAANLSNTDKGAGAGEVMIHELVHQWWGLGNMFDVSEPDSPWSAEGLTVYTTYRIAKELYGEAYAQEHYVDQWQQAVDDYYLNFYVRNPEYLEMLPEEKQLEITGSLTYVRQYCEMPLKNPKGGGPGRRRGSDGSDFKGTVQPGDRPHESLSDLSGFSGCLWMDKGGSKPCVKYSDMSVNGCFATDFLPAFCWRSYSTAAGAEPRDDSGSIPHCAIFFLELL